MKRDNFVHCSEDSPTNLLCTQFFFTALLACYTGSFYILCVLIISLIIIRLFLPPRTLIFVHSLSESRLELYIHPRCIFTFLSSQYNFFFRKRFRIGLLFIPFQLQQNVVFMDVLVFILHISHTPFSLRTKCARCDQGILSWY